MIVQLSQSLNLSVIAEGVETEQADALLSFGLGYAQGFYFAKPQTKSDLRKWLIAQKAEFSILLRYLSGLEHTPREHVFDDRICIHLAEFLQIVDSRI